MAFIEKVWTFLFIRCCIIVLGITFILFGLLLPKDAVIMMKNVTSKFNE